MTVRNGVGASVDLDEVPSEKTSSAELLFSESHGRFVISTKSKAAEVVLRASGVPFGRVGSTGGSRLKFATKGKTVAAVDVGAARDAWDTPLERMMG